MLEPPMESWWQCRYCDESFNASKKLTIHMNSHSEYDNTQTTCKDCGNVYGTRKSLWVHRQKKHPRIPNPSPCELCDKTFFDKTELFHHLKTHSNDDVFSHLQEMQQQLEAEQESRQKQEQLTTGGDAGVQEQLSCHICSQRFHDKRVLSKHLRMHEQQKHNRSLLSPENSALFDNSPLAAMLADTSIGGADENNSSSDYNYPSYKGQMVDGQYACDMCPKTFPLMNALKVHRGWHFRSPDGRQITDSNNIWHPDSIPPSKGKRSRSANPPVCPYCNSTFASGNNLRRHIVEVHKRNEAKMRRENGGTSEAFIEKECECQACGITFSNRSEWVDHKISHARTMKPSTTYEWGCEICGKIFTRKERLLVHMLAHLNSKEEDLSQHSNERLGELGFESNSQSSMSSQSHSMQSHDSNNLKAALQKAAAAAPKQSVSLLKQPSLLLQQKQQQLQQQLQKQQQQHQQQQKENANKSEPNSDHEQSNDQTDAEPTHSCDLCQLFFETAKELRAHVIGHINGPESGATSAADTSGAHQEYDDYDEDDDDGGEDDGAEDDGGEIEEHAEEQAEEQDAEEGEYDEDDGEFESEIDEQAEEGEYDAANSEDDV